MLDLNQRIIRNTYVTSTQVDDEIIIIQSETQKCYRVKGVGLLIWQALDAIPSTLNTICDYVQKYCQVDRNRCVIDASQFIEAMVKQDILMLEK